AGSDYTAASGTVTFNPFETSKTATVSVLGDSTDETDETFTVTLANPTGGAGLDGGGAAVATGTIDDDDGPAVSIAGPGSPVTEGDSGTTNATFTVSLSAASPQTVTVAYATADGTATAGSDYTATSGTLTFTPGQTNKTVARAVNGDTVVQGDETFVVQLSGVSGKAGVGTNEGTATIVDDDRPGYVVVSSDGVVSTYGSAPAAGSVAGVPLSHPIVGSAMTPSGNGYWLVASD